MRYLYSIGFYLLLPVAFLRLYLRGRKAPAYRLRWRERLGYTPLQLSQCIWVHAVSLGETIAAVPLIKWLQKTYPNETILVTNMTPTGSAHTQKTFGQTVQNGYLPYDVPCAMQRFLKRINPSMLMVMETELWPNMIHYTQQRNIPIILANARMSEKSARGYAKISALTAPMLRKMTCVAAQYQSDGDRFVALGLPREKLAITGSIKFDITVAADVAARAQTLKATWQGRPVWMAGSTHEGEEEQILNAHRVVLKQYPNALLILVPRHPERFGKVKNLCEQQGFSVVTRSSQAVCTDKTNLFLGDTMGEMMLLYAATDVAFVGGSLVPTGGHNLLEPAALAKPGLTGPHFFNFMDITNTLIKAEAVALVQSAEELATQVQALFADANRRTMMGKQGLQIVEQNRGALQKLCQLIQNNRR